MNSRKTIETLITNICESKNINFKSYRLDFIIQDIVDNIETIAADIDLYKYDCFYKHKK